MGCGGSVKAADTGQEDLKAKQAQIAERRREVDSKDQQIQDETQRLVQSVNQRGQEARDREELERELANLTAAQARELLAQREKFQAEHQQALRDHLAGHLAEAAEEQNTETGGDAAFKEELSEEVERAQAESRSLVRLEEERAARAREQLINVRAEVRQLQTERDSEAEAATVTREAFLAERRAAKRQDEMVLAEVRTQASETDALGDSYKALEGKARSLQHELNKVSYTVGQKDHELKVKDSELHEVRQSLGCVQDEMDVVNRQLQEQCSRVQRVESSLRCSRDLGAKVATLREMLKESHSALNQMSSMLEQERARREQCTQGLKQQRVRTELLLQLLHHFKNRTQDLAPQTLMNSQSISPEFAGSSRGNDHVFPPLSMRG